MSWLVWIGWAIGLGGLVPVGLGIWGAVRRERRFGVMALAGAAITVLAGMGGTVVGLVVAFGAIESAAPEVKAQLLSDGIGIAMTSTRNGLVTASAGVFAGVVGLVRSRTVVSVE